MRTRLSLVLALLLVAGGSASLAWGQALPCSECGPGSHWIDGCASGLDQIPSNGAVVGISTDIGGPDSCTAGINLVLTGECSLLTVSRSNPLDDSNHFPGLRPVDAHLDVIDTEIISMCLTNGTVTLRAGQGQGGIISPSLGAIAEDPVDPLTGESFFDVFFEVDLGGGQFLYNHTPLKIQADITCVPPQVTYLHPLTCLHLFTNPNPGQGIHVANLVTAEHSVNIPGTSTVTLILMVVLLLAAGALFMVLRRRNKEVAA